MATPTDDNTDPLTIWSELGYGLTGRYEGGNLVLRRADLPGHCSEVMLQRADIPNVVALLVRGGHVLDHVQTLHAIREGWARALTACNERVAAVEISLRDKYQELCGRSNALDEKVGANQRFANTQLEQERELRQRDAAARRDADAEMRTELGDLRQHAAGVDIAIDGQEGLRVQVAALSELYTGMGLQLDQVQAVLGTGPVAKAGISDAVLATFATREYVDQGLARLSGALREHVQQVMIRAIALAAPAPGLLRRLVAAMRPPEPPPITRRGGAGVTPEAAARAGAAAARASVP